MVRNCAVHRVLLPRGAGRRGLSPSLPARPRRHRVEAAGLALHFGALARLAQVQESGGAEHLLVAAGDIFSVFFGSSRSNALLVRPKGNAACLVALPEY
jgi:hypothetical protein